MSDTFRKAYAELAPMQITHINEIKSYAERIEDILKEYPSRQASLAMTNLEQAVMWATKAIT